MSNSPVFIEKGVLHLDGRPTFVWSADYPYYRDERADWSRQLDNLKKMDVGVVTFYLSWRHHAPRDPLKAGGEYDFDGSFNDRTDVLEFIRLVREKGLLCIVKPGPYIHGETRFGSLPDYVMPEMNPLIERRRDIAGRPVHAPYCDNPPAPMDPEFLLYVRDWLRACAREVIVPHEYPRGPIIALQVLNEGVYSRGAAPPEMINFEASAVAHYRRFLEVKYGSLAEYNRARGARFKTFAEVAPPPAWSPQRQPADVLPWLDWAEFCGWFHRLIATTYIGYLREAGATLPVVMNINPPAEARGAWVESQAGRFCPPYLAPDIHYGYTNWCGVVARNPDAWQKYKIVGKMARGINMEENWGFESYDPPHYWYVQPSFFQTLAYMLWGATGLNIYLGVSCDCWTSELAGDPGGMYMGNHPIAHDGAFRDSFWTCRQLGALVRQIGADLVAQPPQPGVGWALYTPWARAASWAIPEEGWRQSGFALRPHAASPGWDTFMALCERNRTVSGVCYPAEEPVADLLNFPALFMGGGEWMDAATQQKLVAYVEGGGVLTLTTRVPDRDDKLQPCTILRDALFAAVPPASGEPQTAPANPDEWLRSAMIATRGKGKAVFLAGNPWQPENAARAAGLVEAIAREQAGVGGLAPAVPEPDDPLIEVAEYRCDARQRCYYYVLTRRTDAANYTVRLHAPPARRPNSFQVQLPAASGALVGFERNRIHAAFIKGVNDIDKSAVAPALQYGSLVLRAADPCDLLFCRRDDGLCEVSVANVQNEHGHTVVTLPLAAAKVARITHVSAEGRQTAVRVKDIEGLAGFTANDMRHVKSVYTPANLAYRATVTASTSNSPVNGPDKAIDGVRGTRWFSAGADDQWLMADLGQVAPIQEVFIGWEWAFAKEYELQFSLDGREWKPVFIEHYGRPGRKVITFHQPKPARFIRLLCLRRAYPHGFAVYELSAHAHPAEEPAPSGEWSPCYLVHPAAG